MGKGVLSAVLVFPDRDATRTELAACLRAARIWVIEATTDTETLRLAVAQPDLFLISSAFPSADRLKVKLEARSPSSLVLVVPPLEQGLSPEALDEAVQVFLSSTLARILEERRDGRAQAESYAVEEKLAALERDARADRQFTSTPHMSRETLTGSPLKSSHPEAFCRLISQYETLIQTRLDQRDYRMEQDAGESLIRMAEEIRRVGGGPRDVIEIHGTALKRKVIGVAMRKAQAYTEEGRLLVLELMGHLVTQYRRGPTPRTRADAREPNSREDPLR